MEKDVFRTRLLHVKGKRVVRCSEVSQHITLRSGCVLVRPVIITHSKCILKTDCINAPMPQNYVEVRRAPVVYIKTPHFESARVELGEGGEETQQMHFRRFRFSGVSDIRGRYEDVSSEKRLFRSCSIGNCIG